VSDKKEIKMKNFVFNSGKFPADRRFQSQEGAFPPTGVPTNENFILPTDSFSRRSAFGLRYAPEHLRSARKAAKPSVTDFTNNIPLKI